ncbi:hypothetical protein N7537_003634 [Penicillium hordei]|uniref:NACHT domain-containing protein n=1 Tax=Penicillium hordei TaxID=40994 RepID=A0AAD6EAV1_9EURO|nr:uncharacterized protein N7537_003634 [Penicillium hordei]KAJ5607015.1 hypothetical protein N7537_003634 [Penicillium hordei]
MRSLLRPTKSSKATPQKLQETSLGRAGFSQEIDTGASKSSTASCFPDGTRLLHDCSDAIVDICFVHGLTGDRDSTWTADGKSTPWPKTFLPSKLHRARILTYGYDAYITRKVVASSNRLIDHATNLLNDLVTDRFACNASSRPLIFVVHSLGGLVCKKAILLSRNNPEPHLRDIFDSTKGVIFMGTPHKGAWMADWAKIPASVFGLVKSTNTTLLDVLKRDSQLLQSIQFDFLAMVRQLREDGRRFEVTCFFEELPMPIVGQIVSKESATLEGYTPLSIHANHRNMVKFRSTEENGFKRLLGELSRWIAQPCEDARLSSRVSSPNERRLFDAGDRACLRDLFITNPCDDKSRIERTKGGLLKDSYRWILDNNQFKDWCYNQEQRLLWIKGHPGKGKTMLLCGIIDELIKMTPDTTLILFCFCQSADARVNNATAILRGIIFQLVDKLPMLIPYVRRQYDQIGKQLFEGINAWDALSKIFSDILEDPILSGSYIIIDALDECIEGMPLLLDLITQKSYTCLNIKWLISSRYWPAIEEQLSMVNQEAMLSLELVDEAISAAVATYIHFKVQKLAERKKYEDGVRETICRHLLSNAHGTFLWVALVCDELAKARKWNALELLDTFPPGLEPLYRRMVEQVRGSQEIEIYERILRVVIAVYRPITLEELPALVDIPDGVSNDNEFLTEVIGGCGSFLILRERDIFFVHQSAKDFLLETPLNETLLSKSHALTQIRYVP